MAATQGPDTLAGGAGPDSFDGLDGSDAISGADGADTLSGGGGSDTLDGGTGNDTLYGYGPADLDDNSGAILATRIGAGFHNPIFAASAPGDPGHLFVVEQHTGDIRILDPDTATTTPLPFLDIGITDLATGPEQGLLGLAFHPNYAVNGRFYVCVTNVDGDLEVREYTRSANPNLADPSSERTILTIDDASSTNNGGWIGFGPDNNLYIAVGDGGPAGDPFNHAQDIDSLRGKILRINVDVDAFPGDPGRNYSIPAGNPFIGQPGADEVWALGVRNPVQASFDPATGDLYFGDIGQSTREEIDRIPAGAPSGLNFGWHVLEGNEVFDDNTPGNPAPSDVRLRPPVLDYPHAPAPDGGFAVTGGYVYHGPGGAQDVYFFADRVTNQLWSVRVVNGHPIDFVNHTGQLQVNGGLVDQIASFAVDGNGHLYTVGFDGEIHLLTPSTAAADGADHIHGGTGDDAIHGGAGADQLFGDDGADSLYGGLGSDTMAGGVGDDTYFVSAPHNVLSEASGEGTDIVIATTSYMLAPNLENLTLTGSAPINGSGNILANTILGNVGANILNGGSGNDVINGGQGNDTIIGGPGKELLTGSGGLDRFVFQSPSESGVAFAQRDVINTFAHGDKIDLSAIDANSTTGGNQAFTFVTAFTGVAGQLQWDQTAPSGFLIQGDTDGNGGADFSIQIYAAPGFGTPQSWDFIL